jgi:hypothetical protein
VTLAALVESKRTNIEKHLARRMETVDAVYDDDLWSILARYGMLQDLDAGLLRCYVTGVPLTRENIGGVLGTPNGPRLISNSLEALSQATP